MTEMHKETLAEEIAVKADREKDISRFFTNNGKIMPAINGITILRHVEEGTKRSPTQQSFDEK